jgi:hypothetical protein
VVVFASTSPWLHHRSQQIRPVHHFSGRYPEEVVERGTVATTGETLGKRFAEFALFTELGHAVIVANAGP